MDMSIPWESHTEKCLVRKRNSVDPGFGIGVTNVLEEEILFGRHARESSGSSTEAARARQEAGCQALYTGEILTPSKVNGITGASRDCSHEWRWEGPNPWSALRLTPRKCHQTDGPT